MGDDVARRDQGTEEDNKFTDEALGITQPEDHITDGLNREPIGAFTAEASKVPDREGLEALLSRFKDAFNAREAHLEGQGTSRLAATFVSGSDIEVIPLPDTTIAATGDDLQGTKIKHITGSVGGSKVGLRMIADPLGPDHPNGSATSTSNLIHVMSRLVTDPSKKDKGKYVRGHLLNDNLGGKGTDENLFPITAAANKAHSSQIEEHVKTLVNDDNQWVRYEVSIKGTEYKPESRQLNSTIEASVYEYHADGKLTSSPQKSVKITSSAGKEAAVDESAEVEMLDATVGRDVMPADQVPDRTTARDETIEGFRQEVQDTVEEYREMFKEVYPGQLAPLFRLLDFAIEKKLSAPQRAFFQGQTPSKSDVAEKTLAVVQDLRRTMEIIAAFFRNADQKNLVEASEELAFRKTLLGAFETPEGLQAYAEERGL